MNLWIISIVRSMDFLCNILFYISLLREVQLKRYFFTSLIGVIFIPSKEALQAMLG